MDKIRKLYPYLALIPIIGFALIPPINVGLEAPSPLITTWLILIAAFFGFYTLFLKTNLFVKAIAIGGFINCFFSRTPYLSFITYLSVVTCCYFYIFCTRIENWKPIFKALQIVVLLNVVLILFQISGNDKLLNFGLPSINCYGTIGSCNQVGGLINSLTAILVLVSPFYLALPLAIGIVAKSMGTFFAGMLGLFVWLSRIKLSKVKIIVAALVLIFFILMGIKQNDFKEGSGRTPVWKKTIQLANQHPIAGWGMGSYKYIMNSYIPTFRMAHNSSLQVLFEFGYPGLIFLIALFGILFYKLIKIKSMMCVSGLTILVTDSMLHFPDRQIQVVLIIILFLAYCTKELSHDRNLASRCM